VGRSGSLGLYLGASPISKWNREREKLPAQYYYSQPRDCGNRHAAMLYNRGVAPIYTMPTTAIAPTRQLIEGDRRSFRELFNRKAFLLRHHLENHPLFQLPRLLEFAKKVAAANPRDMHYDSGDVGINQRWSEVERGGLPIDEAIRRIQDEKAWIFFKWAEKDPDYSALLDECLEQIQELSGVELKRVMKVREAILFITSPNRVTTYHIDRECNFLLQIQGSKTIYIFDREDREVLTEEEIERFWSVDNNAPRYKEQYQDRASAYHLHPGDGVHIPVNSPHWLKNDDNVSISLSVNFQYHDSDRANLYRINHSLRRLGLRPTPPGQSVWRDAAKKSVFDGMNRARGFLQAFKTRS
jgi:hypothetical protein